MPVGKTKSGEDGAVGLCQGGFGAMGKHMVQPEKKGADLRRWRRRMLGDGRP